MRARIRLIGRAGDLQVVVARFLFGHAELAHRHPVLHAGDGRAWRELLTHSLVLEVDDNLNLAAAMHVGLDACAAPRLQSAGNDIAPNRGGRSRPSPISSPRI